MTPAYIPAPSRGDLLERARADGWPEISFAGVTFGPGEERWRQAVQDLDDDARMKFWQQPWRSACADGVA